MVAKKERFQPYEGWKMHTYAPARGEWSACPYYRINVPFLGLQKLGLAECFMDRGTHNESDPVERDKHSVLSMSTADIDLFYAADPTTGLRSLDTLKAMRPGTLMGKLIYPPSTVYDIDDNLDWVHPFNPTYSFYGVRTESGDMLEPGHSVGTKLQNGQDIILWQDGVTRGSKGILFDIQRNLKWNENLHEFVRRCDGFTTPSKYLAKYMKERHSYPLTHVFPNSIVPEDWCFPKLAPRKKGIRILWQGGGSHMSDWYALRPALGFIAKKYPHVTFVIFGEHFQWATKDIPENQLELHPWVPYDSYKLKRAILDCDINLCVLRNDEFSRSKSAIKFYEGSLNPHHPEATLAPNMPPYNEDIVDGVNGLLYEPDNDPRIAAENFAANLEHLIKNADLRKKVAAQAHADVLEKYHYLKTVPALHEFYHELRLRKMKDCPYDPTKDSLPLPPKTKKVTRSKRKAVKARKTKK